MITQIISVRRSININESDVLGKIGGERQCEERPLKETL